MVFVIERDGDVFEPVAGSFQSGTGEDAINHPAGWLEAAKPDELADARVHLVEPATVPENKVVLSISYARVDGKVVQVLELDDAPVAVPQSVTPRQLRLALLGAGRLGQVEAFVTGDQAPPEAVISWEYATEFRRTDPMLNQLADALSPPLSQDHIDQIFSAAARIK